MNKLHIFSTIISFGLSKPVTNTEFPTLSPDPFFSPNSQKYGDETNQEVNINKNIWQLAYKQPIQWMIKPTEFMPDITKTRNKENNIRELRKVFQKAFKLWEQETQFRFVEVGNEEKAEIKISFGEQDHGDSFPFSGGELAHAFSPGTRNRDDISGDIHFWNKYKWVYGKPKNSGERNIYVTAIHELGHALGLDHNNDNITSIMYPIAISSWDWQTESELPDCDKASIIALYGEVPGFFERQENIMIICFAAVCIVLCVVYKSLSTAKIIPKNNAWKSRKEPKPPGFGASLQRGWNRVSNKFRRNSAENDVPVQQETRQLRNNLYSLASSGFSDGEVTPEPNNNRFNFQNPIQSRPNYNFQTHNLPKGPKPAPPQIPNKSPNLINQIQTNFNQPEVPNTVKPARPAQPPQRPRIPPKNVGFQKAATVVEVPDNTSNPPPKLPKKVGFQKATSQPPPSDDNITASNAASVFGVQLKSRR